MATRRSVNFLVVGGLFILFNAASALMAEEIIFQDNFDSYNAAKWGSKPLDVTVADGTLVNAPSVGQRYLSSLKKFGDDTLEMRVKFNKVGGEIFYYLGFQSITPWTYDMCWITVQGSSVSISAQKGGQQGFKQPVADIVINKWYVFKIVRAEKKVEFFLDDKLIGKTENTDFVPDSKMPIFLSANTVKKTAEGDCAELEIDWLKITSRVEKNSSKLVLEKKVRFSCQKQVGQVGGPLIQFDTNSVHLENRHFTCNISLVYGLKWERIFNKAMEEECLFEDNNSDVFMLIRKQLVMKSSDFDVTDALLADEGKTKTLRILLNHPKYKIDCVIAVKLNDTDEMLWSLEITNNSKRSTTLQPIFPILGRLNIADNLEDTTYFFPWRSGIVGSVDCELNYEYGGLAWMQIISVYNPDLEGGVYTYPKDSKGGFKGLIIKKATAEPEAVVRHSELVAPYITPRANIFEFDEGLGFAYYYMEQQIPPGGQYALPETAVSIYRGTWKKPLQDYSKWAHTWYKPLDVPQWLLDCFNYLPRHKPSYYSEEEKRYVGTEKFIGGEHIVQWAHWWDYDEDKKYPADILMGAEQPGDFDYNKRRGGLKAFAEEIKKTQAKDTRFTVYVDHRFCCNETNIGKAKGKEWAAVYTPGGGYEGYGSAADQYVTCYHDANAWADYLAETCGRIVKDTGMDGIYLDELALPFACYNPEHVHTKKYNSIIHIPTFTENIIKARDAMRRANPEAILMTEHAGSDYFTQFIDSSWTQTFYNGFPFSEKYFDRHSLNYFHFCFPEFKLAHWGQSEDAPRRCFFNGIGIDWGVGGVDYLQKTGQVLRENGDAFASTKIEPLVETKVQNVLANKFPIEGKTVYTIYNKNDKVVDREIIEVNPYEGYHSVELLYDNEVNSRSELFKSKRTLALKIMANDVVCVAQFPEIIQTEKKDNDILISLKKEVKDSKLIAYLDVDTSHLGMKDGKIINLQNGQAVINTEKLFGRKGKVILKLLQGYYLVDEVIVEH